MSVTSYIIGTKMPKICLDASALTNNKGNAAIISGVVSIVAVVIVLILGNILAGAFSKVATSTNLGLDQQWLDSLNTTAQMAATTFSIGGMLPIAIIAGLMIGVVSYMIVR